MPLLPKVANTANNNAGLEDRTPLPAGDYLVHIVKTEFKETKAKNGHYLSVHMKVLDGDHKGRTLFSNLNLNNPNSVAVDIANKELNSICKACGKQGVEDSDELLQIPMIASVTVSEGDAQYLPQNRVNGYQSVEGGLEDAPTAAPVAVATPAQVVAAAAVAAPAASAKKLPWE